MGKLIIGASTMNIGYFKNLKTQVKIVATKARKWNNAKDNVINQLWSTF